MLFLLLFIFRSFTQCIVQTGPAPESFSFYTGGEAPGAQDQKWTVAIDDIAGPYNPAIVMALLPSIYYNSSSWISFSANGEHSGNKNIFYKLNFELPCFNPCGKSFNDENIFCMNLDLYADNSIYEVYVNDIPQSANQVNFVRFPDPYNPVNHTQSDKTTVSLCKNWKAGNNSVIIQVASSATVAGLMVQASVNPPPPPDAYKIFETICDGEHFLFGSLDLTKSGSYLQKYLKPNGCDSNVVLNLTVNPKSLKVVNQSICEGETYQGYNRSGTYINRFNAANGCDSIETLNLVVEPKPDPELGNKIGLCEGDSLALSPGLFSTYLWQDGSKQDKYIVKSPGSYSVIVTNACGTGQDNIIVTSGSCNMFFPTAFTPDHNGKNDFFKLLSDMNFQDYKLSIYNRWGQKVFSTTNPTEGWNGTYRSKKQPSSVFVWFCSFKRSDVVTKLKGFVTLIR